MKVLRTLAILALPVEGDEPDPWWAIATPLVLAVAVGVYHLVRHWRRRKK